MFIIVFVNIYLVFELIVIINVSVFLQLHAAQTVLLCIHM